MQIQLIRNNAVANVRNMERACSHNLAYRLGSLPAVLRGTKVDLENASQKRDECKGHEDPRAAAAGRPEHIGRLTTMHKHATTAALAAPETQRAAACSLYSPLVLSCLHSFSGAAWIYSTRHKDVC